MNRRRLVVAYRLGIGLDAKSMQGGSPPGSGAASANLRAGLAPDREQTPQARNAFEFSLASIAKLDTGPRYKVLDRA